MIAEMTETTEQETFTTFLPNSSHLGRHPSPAAVRFNKGSLRFNTKASKNMLAYFGETEVSIRIGAQGTVVLIMVEETERGRRLTVNQRTGTVSLSVRGLNEQIVENSYPLDELPEGFSFTAQVA